MSYAFIYTKLNLFSSSVVVKWKRTYRQASAERDSKNSCEWNHLELLPKDLTITFPNTTPCSKLSSCSAPSSLARTKSWRKFRRFYTRTRSSKIELWELRAYLFARRRNTMKRRSVHAAESSQRETVRRLKCIAMNFSTPPCSNDASKKSRNKMRVNRIKTRDANEERKGEDQSTPVLSYVLVPFPSARSRLYHERVLTLSHGHSLYWILSEEEKDMMISGAGTPVM